MSCDRVLEIARQYEVDKNSAQAELKRVSRKLADITNNDSDNDNNSGHRPKRRRINQPSPPTDSDEEDMGAINRG